MMGCHAKAVKIGKYGWALSRPYELRYLFKIDRICAWFTVRRKDRDFGGTSANDRPVHKVYHAYSPQDYVIPGDRRAAPILPRSVSIAIQGKF